MQAKFSSGRQHWRICSLAAQILGHARINSSRRYFALASEQIRQCCLPLENFACIKEGLR